MASLTGKSIAGFPGVVNGRPRVDTGWRNTYAYRMIRERIRYITQAWLVVVLSLGFGAALAGIQLTLQPRIEQNRLNDTLGQIPRLVPGAAGGTQSTEEGGRLFLASDTDGQPVGWVRTAGGPGFADRIELLIGLDLDGRTITGLSVLEQTETPGLGNRITEDQWLEQFRDRPAARRIRLVKSGPAGEGEVEAVTGATISSQSVVDIVNRAASQPVPAPETEVSP